MLNPTDSLILGTVQGLTEFLPISSSGHLILARELLGLNTESGLVFDAVLQLGTILAVYVFFRKDVIRLIRAFLLVLAGKKSASSAEDRTLLFAIVLGTIPALILGLLLEEAMETIFRSPLLVACTLVVGSALFWFAERSAKENSSSPSLKQGWWIGVFQVLALVPGMSRSGSTISGGLFLGLKRDAATRFSFLLSLPIITGSGLLALAKIVKNGETDFAFLSLATGFIASFMVGYLCISWLVGYLKKHTLSVFIWYRLLLSVAVLTALILK
ncbi:MAG: undecaprenyl-diphosphatase UppP [Patescibacteria group bacterium]|nr:undecaprenyl-diphosphatase UppP [Patescibacteria group bacterium]